MAGAVLSIHDLTLTMKSFDGEAHVLNGIDLEVRRGEIWRLVGESGRGKPLTGLSIWRLVPPAGARGARRSRRSPAQTDRGWRPRCSGGWAFPMPRPGSTVTLMNSRVGCASAC